MYLFIKLHNEKRRKNLSTFKYYMCMADKFNISDINRKLVIDKLNEPLLEDYDIIGIAEKSIQMVKLFGVDMETYNQAQTEVLNQVKMMESIEVN